MDPSCLKKEEQGSISPSIVVFEDSDLDSIPHEHDFAIHIPSSSTQTMIDDADRSLISHALSDSTLRADLYTRFRFTYQCLFDYARMWIRDSGRTFVEWCNIQGNKWKNMRTRPADLQSLPPEMIQAILSFCSYSTVISFAHTCKAFHKLANDPALLREIAHTTYSHSPFAFEARWSAEDLTTLQLKMVCKALESIICSAGKSKVPLMNHLRWWNILATHSHPLLAAMDLENLHLCLKVSRHWKLRETTEVLTFCITAGTLQRQLPIYQPGHLRTWPEQSEILVFIATAAPCLRLHDVVLPRMLPGSAKALLESSTLLRETNYSLDHYNQCLQSILTPDFLGSGKWTGVYFRHTQTYWDIQSALITSSVERGLKISCSINNKSWITEVATFNMTPFGIVFFCETDPGIVWLWKEEWCELEVPTGTDVNQHSYHCSLTLTLSEDFNVVVDGSIDGLSFSKREISMEDARMINSLSQ